MIQALQPRAERRVALLAEGVDRNRLIVVMLKAAVVALLAEGVDRNCPIRFSKCSQSRSPSSRRAWIEISLRTS